MFEIPEEARKSALRDYLESLDEYQLRLVMGALSTLKDGDHIGAMNAGLIWRLFK